MFSIIKISSIGWWIFVCIACHSPVQNKALESVELDWGFDMRKWRILKRANASQISMKFGNVKFIKHIVSVKKIHWIYKLFLLWHSCETYLFFIYLIKRHLTSQKNVKNVFVLLSAAQSGSAAHSVFFSAAHSGIAATTIPKVSISSINTTTFCWSWIN